MTEKFSQSTQKDAALREFLATALPTETASPDLRARVAQMAVRADAKRALQASKRGPRRRLAFSAATLAVLAAIFWTVWPRVMSNQALAQINAAMSSVSSAHITGFRIQGGKRITENETYFQNGQWRVESPEAGYVTLFKNGTRWDYSAVRGTVTVKRSAKSAFSRNPTGFTLADITRDLEMQDGKISVALQGQTTLNGRAVKRVSMQSKNNYETSQFTFLVDAETDLPFRGELNVRNRYGVSARKYVEMSYNRRLSAKLFEPKFGRGARFVEQGRRDADLQTRLARGLAKKRVGERTIAIRELQVNRNGDVFLLYTAGKRLGAKTGDGFRSGNWLAGRDWKVFLSDSLGTRYHYYRYGLLLGYPRAAQGQRLEGDWWIPTKAAQPGRNWQARTFFLNFEVNPKNLHGTFKQTFKDDYSAQVRFQIPIDEAEKSVVPSLVSSLQLGLNEETIVKEASQQRGELPPGVEPSPQLVREVDEIGSFSPDSRHIATGILGGVKLVDVQNGELARILRAPAPFAKSRADTPLFSADGKVVCAALYSGALELDSDRQFCVWNRENGQLLATWRRKAIRDVSLRSAALSPDGKTLRLVNSIVTRRGGQGKDQWVESMNASVEERDILSGKVFFERVLKHDGFLSSIEQATLDSADWMVITSQNSAKKRGVMRAWNARSDALPGNFGAGKSFDNQRISVAKRAPLLAVIGQDYQDKKGVREFADREIRVFDVPSGQLRRSIFAPAPQFADALAVSDDGKWVASEGGEFKISLWNTQTGRLERTLTGHYSQLSQLAFSPDGKWLQSVDVKDKTLLWRLP